jgi:serine/threonine protein kinase
MPSSLPSLVGVSFDYGRFELVEHIGTGTYGQVYMAVDALTNRTYAVKCLQRPPHYPHKPSLERTEIQIHQRLPYHPNIVSLKRVVETPDYLFMVMDYCRGGDLYDNIVHNPRFSGPGNDELVRKLFLQAVDAAVHCHRFSVYHRDLKVENFAIVSPDGSDIKLLDFGLATTSCICSDIVCGSSYYMIPECQGGLDGTAKCYSAETNDVWSLGVILVNLACGRNPWNQACLSDPTFSAFVRDPNFLSQVLPISSEFNHIIRRVFELDPRRRASLAELRALVASCPHFMRPLQPSSSVTSESTLLDEVVDGSELDDMLQARTRASAWSLSSADSAYSFVDLMAPEPAKPCVPEAMAIPLRAPGLC